MYLIHHNFKKIISFLTLPLQILSLFIFWILFIFLHLGANSLFAQESIKKYSVTGILIEADSKEPMALTNIIIDSLKTGVATNLDGEFLFSLPSGNYKLSIKSIGFDDTYYNLSVSDSNMSGIVITVERKSYEIESVIILPGENPAHRIIKNATKNRDKNRIKELESYQYEAYNKTTITLNNITQTKLDKSIFLAPTRSFLKENANDTTVRDSNQRYKLGIFISESISEVYYKKPQKKEIIIGRKSTGIDNNESNFITALIANVDLYENYIEILEKEFLSPIASGALMNYKFYLIDTIFVPKTDGTVDSIYGIEVKAKRKFDKVFTGRIYIESSSWALKKVDLKMNEDPNINFVEGVRIRQEFINVSGHWMPSIKDIEVDFKNADEKMGFIGRTATFSKNYKIGVEHDKERFKGLDIELKNDAYSKDSAFWSAERQSPLEKSDHLAYRFIGDLKKRSIWQLILFANEIMTSGRKTIGKIEVGPYSKIFSFNAVEGPRLQIGLNTNKLFSKKWYFSGYIAYGFKDKKFKYDLEASYQISAIPLLRVSISHTFDVEQPGFKNFNVDGMGILYSTLMRVPLYKLNYFRETDFRVHMDITKGLTGFAYIKQYHFKPAFNYYYIHNDMLKSEFRTGEIGGSFRFSIKEEYVLRGGERINTGSKFPVFYIDVSAGFKGLLGGEFNYQKLSISLMDKVKAGRFGWMNYSATIGQIFGTLPLANLYIFRGSQSLTFDPMGYYMDALKSYLGSRNRSTTFDGVGFNLMYFYEFSADRYAVAGFDHHFEGWLYNKLPGIRWIFHKLKWKEVVSARFGIGTMTSANRMMNSPEKDPRFINNPEIQNDYKNLLQVKTPDKMPYWELGVGMENIFKIFRVDFIWRLNYLNPEAPAKLAKYNYNYGIRFYATLAF